MKMVGSAITLLGKQILLSAPAGEAPARDFGASSEKTEHEEAEKVREDEETLKEEQAIKSKNGGHGETDQRDKNPEEKTWKKSVKILPCPRCKSMETKFCYYNNYNVNQPRHFCKACQRYWTSGGTMRTMPVGAGRRKNKSSSLAHRHITMPETFQPVRINGKVVSFCSSTGISNGYEKIKIGDDCSCLSSDSVDEGVSSHKQYFIDLNIGPSRLPFFPWPSCPAGSNPPWFPSWLSSPSSPKDSPTLGKHSRDSDMSETCNSDRGEQFIPGSVLVPKTLRIRNPEDAAKSSIWATLGIKNDSLIGRGDMFKDFQSKAVERSCFSERSSVLQANPAALTRSLTFHETA